MAGAEFYDLKAARDGLHRLPRQIAPGRSWVAAVMVLAAISSARAADISVDNARAGKPPLVSIIGEIDPDDGGKFSSLVAGLPTAIVGLESPGGNMLASLRIGEIIRKKRFATVVPDQMTCASGCALIWLAGVRRYVANTAKIGFHSAYDPVAREQSGLGNEMISAYLAKLGLSYEAILYMTSASPTDMRWLHSDDARRLGIAADELGSIDANAPPPAHGTASQAKSEAEKFVTQFFNLWSVFSGSDLSAALAREYADTVEYFGDRKTARDVLTAKQVSLRWWPVQDYKLRRETLTTNCAEGNLECVVTGIVDWYYKSPQRSVSAAGDSRFSLSLRRVSPTRFVIVREDAVILSKRTR
jgi:hypothetical protein